jgi:hypothetical protein
MCLREAPYDPAELQWDQQHTALVTAASAGAPAAFISVTAQQEIVTNRVLHLGGVVTSKQQEKVAKMVQCQESLVTVARLVQAAVGACAVATPMPTEIIVEDMFVTTQTLPMQSVTSAMSTVTAASAVAEVAVTSTAFAGGATGAGPAAGVTAVAAVV